MASDDEFRGGFDSLDAAFDAVARSFTEDASEEQLKLGWRSVDIIEARIGFDDKDAAEIFRVFHKQLSEFVGDVRRGVPSPYTGFRGTLVTLQERMGPRVGIDGWPKKR